MLDSLVSDGKFDLLDLDTIMIDAVRYDDAQFAEALFSHGLPLHPDYALEAAKWKAKNVLEALFKNGWNVNKPISDAQPPGQLLFHALDRESEVFEVLTLLLKEGAPLNATMYQNHPFSWSLYAFMGLGTILHKATELGKVDVVRFLVHDGVDLSIKDANGDTALDCARRLSKLEVVQLLEDSIGH
ncbi:hypothetical protein N7517_005412 [Penicillium concentricum]|uniref:Uncharacterized protein n=1 Tax=Penicillium concentricum TaxID=293559 RepID=A0A9W9VBK4_9EURO|nr:uncharacterized protein N7517_005412 [Penicillium concentricum]KAJ5373406.1 hypothetical protein N7517_005412 [Penicillium concentricum]